MKIYILFFVVVASMVSCTHTAIAPVCSPSGEIAVVKVPNARWGQKVKPETLSAMQVKIEKGIVSQFPANPNLQSKPITGVDGGVLSLSAELVTKQGEKFVGYLPIIFIRTTGPADEADRAAGRLASAYYRSAKKLYQVYPVSAIKDVPKNKLR